MPRSGVYAKTTIGLLFVSYVYSNLFDRYHVGECGLQVIHVHGIFDFDWISFFLLKVGIVLDKTRGSSSSRYIGRNISADAIHATCQIPGLPTARLLPESGGRFHVRVHDIRVHGIDGVLFGEYYAG